VNTAGCAEPAQQGLFFIVRNDSINNVNPDEVLFRGKYIWHRQKNEHNKKEHDGIGFEEAVGVFDDPFAIEEYDVDNSDAEDRYNVTGNINGKWLVITVTMTPRGELIRIISAREADSLEQEAYNENIRNITGAR